MRRSIARFLLLAAVVGTAVHPSLVASEDVLRSPLADLAWIAGAWHLERPDGYLDERWSPPVGNSMVGHFRWVRGDALWITELLTITEEEGEVIFRLRHFSDRMRPWEDPDDAFVYRLADRAPGRLVFTIAEPRAGRPDRVIYEALPGDSLLVRLEGERQGEAVVQEFRYGPAGMPASISVGRPGVTAHGRPAHSCRRASIGSALLARRAGRYVAPRATKEKIAGTTANVSGSTGCTP